MASRLSFLSDWSTNKAWILARLDKKKLQFSRRSAFFKALGEAVGFLNDQRELNQHLVIISDRVDSFDKSDEKESALQALFFSDICVHVVSYTAIQRKAMKETLKNSPSRKPELSPGAEPPLRGNTPTVIAFLQDYMD
jgi:hypothetical protein